MEAVRVRGAGAPRHQYQCKGYSGPPFSHQRLQRAHPSLGCASRALGCESTSRAIAIVAPPHKPTMVAKPYAAASSSASLVGGAKAAEPTIAPAPVPQNMVSHIAQIFQLGMPHALRVPLADIASGRLACGRGAGQGAASTLSVALPPGVGRGACCQRDSGHKADERRVRLRRARGRRAGKVAAVSCATYGNPYVPHTGTRNIREREREGGSACAPPE